MNGSAVPVLKAIVVSKALTSRIHVITFTNSVLESMAQQLGASFALVTFTLFAANGAGVSALAKTSWIFSGLVGVSLLFLLLIPKRMEGIHEVDSSSAKRHQVESPEAIVLDSGFHILKMSICVEIVTTDTFY